MSAISQQLQDLLVREAHLRLSRAQLAPVLAEKEAELAAVLAQKPGMFAGKEKKIAHEAQAAEAAETARLLRDGVRQLDRIEPQLRQMLRDDIEDMLRSSCPEYMEALAAHAQREDWRRCLERFTQRVFEFLQTLGNARNMACTGYSRATQGYSQAAVHGFVVAIATAEKVEAEVHFANRIADLQVQAFAKAGLGEGQALPKLPEVNYAVWVSTISSRSLVEAQMQFEALITDVKKLHETGIPGLVAQAEAADASQGSLIEGFLEAAWEQLRDEIAPLVKPEETEASVADTEIMLVGRARLSVLARGTDQDVKWGN